MSAGEDAPDPVMLRVEERRERHRRRPLVLRALTVAGGFALLVPAVLLVPLVPELGVPLLLAALGLLALEFAWAARALAWTIRRWDAAKAWWRRQRGGVKLAVVVAAVLLVAAAVALLAP